MRNPQPRPHPPLRLLPLERGGVRRAGTYEVALWRWPSQLARPMGCVRATIALAGVEAEQALAPTATCARFRIRLAAGPGMLLTTLRRADGKEHGAYFADVRFVE